MNQKRTATPSPIISRKKTCRTMGEGDCAFHAILGVKSKGMYTCPQALNRRQEWALAVRQTQDPEMIRFRSESIMALIMGNAVNDRYPNLKGATEEFIRFSEEDNRRHDQAWIAFELELNQQAEFVNWITTNDPNKNPDRTLKDRVDYCKNHASNFKETIAKYISLNQAFEVYEKTVNTQFNWDPIVSSLDVIKDYANFVSQKGQWLLPVEIQSIAHYFKVSVEYWAVGNAQPEIFNPGQENAVSIQFNGTNHYERMEEEKPKSTEPTGMTTVNRSEGEEEEEPSKLPCYPGIHWLSKNALLRLCNGNSAQSVVDWFHANQNKIDDQNNSSDDVGEEAGEEGSQVKERHETRTINFSKCNLTGSIQSEIDEVPYELELFLGVSKIINPLRKALGPFVAQESMPSTENERIHLLGFVVDSASRQPRLAFTSGDAWRVVVQLSSHHFPTLTAQKLFESRIRSFTLSDISGAKQTATSVYKFLESVSTWSKLDKVIRGLTGKLKENSALETMDEFNSISAKGKKKPILPELEISKRQVKIHHAMTLPEIVNVACRLGEIYRDKSVPENPDLNYLQFVVPVAYHLRDHLDGALAKLILNKRQNLPPFLFSHRDFGKFSQATHIQVILNGDKIGQFTKDLSSISLGSAIKLVESELTGNSDRDIQTLRSIRIKYRFGGKWCPSEAVPFLDCIHCELPHKKKEDGTATHYFKLDGLWYEVAADYLVVLEENFVRVLRDHLFDENRDVNVAVPDRCKTWNKQAHAIGLQSSATQMDDGHENEDAQSVSSKGSASSSGSKSSGRIRQKKGFSLKNLKEALELEKGLRQNSKIVEALVEEELIKKREDIKVTQYQLTETAKKIGEGWVPQSDCLVPYTEKLKQFFEQWSNPVAESKVRNRDENIYNQTFDESPEFLVGDCRTPYGLELFDVLKIIRTDDECHLVLYHNKIGFGHHVRDVCSQIRNAAEVLLNDRRKSQPVLREFYQKLVTNPGVGPRAIEKLTALLDFTEDDLETQFIELFSQAKFTFVFGFMEDAKSNRSLYEERDRDLSHANSRSRSRFKSSIARLELIRLAKKLNKLKVDFRILPIGLHREAEENQDEAEENQDEAEDAGGNEE